MGGTIGLPAISVMAHEIELRAKRKDLKACQELVAEFVTWADSFTAS
jgi:HPt (histidine-containing phosphotransfer) domain-containing protein